MRQPMIRWSQPFFSHLMLHEAVEDPSSNDVVSDQPSLGKTSYPDAVLGLEYDADGSWHLRLNSILRHIETDVPGGGEDNDLGWGMALTGHLNVFERDRLRLGGFTARAWDGICWAFDRESMGAPLIRRRMN